ncbi:MAG: Holliday junction ATP-dependent DNA helicase RuvA [Candidatus Kapaibacterium sp.]|nr:MAG: Holliday junction ATP-dependent DNA helicase RuvA [Candidatus Kapabacteria bacterium]
MIARLEGRILEKSPSHVIIDCGGVGYRVHISLTTSEALPPVGHQTLLHTHLIVREDSMELVGFATQSERDAFLLLTAIPGVGMRIALGILSAMSVTELQHAVLANNTVQLQRIPGVGRKTAERLVLELRERIAAIAPAPSLDGNIASLLGESLSALLVLGYNRQVAEKALRTAFEQCQDDGEHPNVEQLVKRALRIVAGQG